MKTRIPPLLITIALVCFALSPKAQAVSPAPDGGYPGGNTAEGQSALLSLTSGTYNTAVGWFSLESVTTGSFNTATGAGTLLFNTADDNTANGAGALLSNTTGGDNTASGVFALFSNTTGGSNTANGLAALGDNTTGSFNTANGVNALLSNTTGANNTATGYQALFNNTTAFGNTATGFQALQSNTTGGGNTANGASALLNNTTGDGNTANGASALLSNTTGHDNTATGASALFSNTTGSNNTALGGDAGGNITTASNVICIGALGENVSNSCFIGNIHGVTTQIADAIPVLIDSVGQLGTISSSRRFKKEIKPMDDASESILALKPVTFHYKSDNTNRPEFGLIAEEVAEVNPHLVVRDEKGEIYTVRYDAVNAMLLNEFLKEHKAFLEEQRKIEAQEKTIAELKSGMTALAATVKEQALQIQKVSAQLTAASPSRGGLEASKFATGRIRRGGPAPQTVLNNQ